MIQGTASHVGKSVMTAALCRIFKNRGYRVAPFKAQNMSNNSYVTPGGLEVARAQAVQAEACGLQPQVEMSPVLLKPESDCRVQAVVMGKPLLRAPSLFDQSYRRTLAPVVLSALEKLRRENELVIIEGAGSPAEVNLKQRDIVNMMIAKAVKAPVILVGDIDCGGVFAQFVGTLALLDRAEKSRVKALLINKFRGNLALLEPGLRWLERKTRRKVLGVVPYLSDMALAEEDSFAGHDSHGAVLRANRRLDAVSGGKRDRRQEAAGQDELLVDVLWLPRISNFTDFDLLARWPNVKLRYLHEPDRHQTPDLLILPGTKSTLADLHFLRKSGLADYVLRCARAGSWIFGICGGYQMLGEKITDPDGVESQEKKCVGLGLLPAVTHFKSQKRTCRVRAFHPQSGLHVDGYEIHMGQTRVSGRAKPLFQIAGKPEGAWLDAAGPGKAKIFGTYLHGLFENPAFLHYFLNERRAAAGLKAQPLEQVPAGMAQGTSIYDQLAQKVEPELDMDFLLKLADLK